MKSSDTPKSKCQSATTVAIARALRKKPKILLLDKGQTSPLTINESEKLFGILHELKRMALPVF